MIVYKTGDILAERADALVNTVNCVGVMGRGIALQFKKAFPENFKAYAKACQRGEVEPGRMFVFETKELVGPRYIINFPTKRHWRGKSRMEDIEAGLDDLKRVVLEKDIRSIAIPPLGSGLGGLKWEEVRPRIEKTFQNLDDIHVILFEPTAAPHTMAASDNAPPKMTPGRAALIGLISRYLAGLLDPFVTLLEVHKLMYFLQEAGEPLRLRYRKAAYGPYAENLRHVLRNVEGYYITGYADGGDAPGKPLMLVPGVVRDAQHLLQKKEDTKQHFERVVDLVSGFESAFGLELLATVHWLLNKEKISTLDELVDATYAWHERKKQFTRRQIALAANTLAEKGWVRPLTG